MRVGVDGETSSDLDRNTEQPPGRIEPLGSAVDLDGHVVFLTGKENLVRIEMGLRPRLTALAPDEQPSRAMPEDVDERVAHRGDHAPGHRDPFHGQLRVHACHDDVELLEKLRLLVERAVIEDVAFDAGQDAKGRQLLVQVGDDAQLLAQSVRAEPAGDGEPRRMICQHDVLVRTAGERACGERHLLDRTAAVAPVRVGMQIAPQRRPQRLAALHECFLAGRQQFRQVAWHLARKRLDDDRCGHLADAGQIGERALRGPLPQLVGRQFGERGRCRPERPHPIRRFARALEQEGDLPERLDRVVRVGTHPDADQYRSPSRTRAAAPTSPAS